MKARKLFTSDLHIGHSNILKFEPVTRPYKSIEEHNERLLKIINHHVNSHDTLYILGDIGFKTNWFTLASFYLKINCNKVLIQGNHDKMTDKFLNSLGFQDIFQEAKIKLGKEIVKLSHYPYQNTDGDYHKKSFKYPVKEDDIWLLYGHIHSKGHTVDWNRAMINVGWDHWQRPVTADEILYWIRYEQEKN